MKISDITANLSDNAHKWLKSAKETLQKNNSRIGSVSDGYHTYDELYNHRAMEFAVICRAFPHLSWKSKLHDDPDFPMFDGMFICGIDTPDGQATYHYDIDPWWDIFEDVKELDRAPKFDGHTPNDVIQRLHSLTKLNGWLPIGDMSSIPKFTAVLVWCPDRSNEYMVYLNTRNEWRIWDQTPAGVMEMTERVTHWKPLGLHPVK